MATSIRAVPVGAAVVAIALAAGFLTARWWSPAPEAPPLRSATALFGKERPVPEFALSDHSGRAYTRQDLTGNWTLLFFGYTHCPDVCPATLATLAASVDTAAALGDGGDAPFRVAFVSVDPERDGLDHLRSYVTVFHGDFLGVTGTHEELRKLTGALGVVYARAAGGAGSAYLVEHSAALLLVNPGGELQAVFGPPHDPDAIARDLAAIRAHLDT